MNPTVELLEKVQAILKKDLRYQPEAYLFVLAGLHFTAGSLPEPRHVTGQELLEGIRLYGLDQFGPLTRQVFQHWGIERTEDFGHIVFTLIEAKLLGKTEEDSLADFKEAYDFETAFAPEPLFKLSEDPNP